jgi:hypothetical protein
VSEAPAFGRKPPRAGMLCLVRAGSGALDKEARSRIALPLGAKLVDDAEDADAVAVALGPADVGDASSMARVLPDPDELPAGTLLFVLPHVASAPSLAGRFLAAMGRGPIASRAVRATALVARGYVRVAAGVDRETRSDLVWGYAPPAAAPVTEPC